MLIRVGVDKLNGEKEDQQATTTGTTVQTIDLKIEAKSNSKKSKATAKSAGEKYQWKIMKNLRIEHDAEIRQFVDPQRWLTYFPQIGKRDLEMMGLKADWRRVFITTDINLFYDSFVRWQFHHFKENGKIHLTKEIKYIHRKMASYVWITTESCGEGFGPKEYTLIKLRIHSDHIPTKRHRHMT